MKHSPFSILTLQQAQRLHFVLIAINYCGLTVWNTARWINGEWWDYTGKLRWQHGEVKEIRSLPYPMDRWSVKHDLQLGCGSPDCGGTCSACTLEVCQTCGLYEGSLTTHCPGVRATGPQFDAVYDGKIDFVYGAWQLSRSPYAPKQTRAAHEAQ